MTDLSKGTRVSIELFHPSVHPRVNGVIVNVRDDGRGRSIYTLSLDKEWTDGGIFYARAEELRVLDGTSSPIDLLDAAEAHVRTMAANAARDRALELLSIAMGEVLAELPESERYA